MSNLTEKQHQELNAIVQHYFSEDSLTCIIAVNQKKEFEISSNSLASKEAIIKFLEYTIKTLKKTDLDEQVSRIPVLKAN